MREKVIQYLSTSHWKDLTDVRSGDIIPCVICDEMIEGHVYVSPKDINVTLHGVKPQLRASSHIMLMAPKIYTVDPFTGSRLNDYGVLRLKELLAGLYHDYRIIRDNEDKIAGLLPEFISAREKYMQEISLLQKRKASLKRSFKDGHHSQKEHMQELAKIKTCLHDEKVTLDRKFKEIFTPILSECVHCDNLMEAVEAMILEK